MDEQKKSKLKRCVSLVGLCFLIGVAIGCGDSHYEKGNIYLRQQRWDDAKQEYEAAIAKKPEDALPYHGLGRVYLATQDYEKALTHFQKALEYDPELIATYNRIAEVYWNRGQRALAIETCEKALAIKPRASTYNLLGKAYLQQNPDISKAEEAFQTAMQVEPDHKEAYMNLPDLYAQIGKFDLAEQHYRNLLDKYPEQRLGYLKLAQLYVRQSQLDKAIETYRALLKIHETNLTAHLVLGELYTRQEKYSDAIGILEAAVKLAPNRPDIYTQLIKLYTHENQFQKVTDTGKRLERLLNAIDASSDTDNTPLVKATREFLYLYQGRAYMSQGDYVNAIQYLQSLVRLTPESATAHFRLGLAYTGLKSYRQAIAEYKTALALDETLYNAHLKMAAAYITINEPKLAMRAVEKLIDWSNKYPLLLDDTVKAEAYHLSGVAYLALGDRKQALDEFQKALILNPNSAEIRVTIGNLYSQQNQLESAIRQYQMAVDHNPQLASAHQGLADVYRLMGNADKAIEAYNKAIELNPSSASAHNNLAWYYSTQKMNLDTALELAKKAVTLAPQTSEYRDTLGFIYYQKGMYLEAISELENASLGRLKNPVVHFHLGLAYYANQELVKARQKLKAALDLDPNFADAAEARTVMQQIEAQQQ